MQGLWNTDIVAGLEPHPEDVVIYETRFSGFYGTDLHERLAALGTRHLIVTGCTTSICVESTVRDAMFRDPRACCWRIARAPLDPEQGMRR